MVLIVVAVVVLTLTIFFGYQLKNSQILSASKKTTIFLDVVAGNLREQGFPLLKIKEFTFVSDYFHKWRNAVIGVFLQSLLTNIECFWKYRFGQYSDCII